MLTLGAAMAGHAMLETARDALFLAKVAPGRLAWVYLAIAAGVTAMAAIQRGCRRFDSRRVLSMMLGAAAVITFAFWLLSARPNTATLYALYVWGGLYATAVVAQFWLAVSELYTITQAKRVYSFIGIGGVAGALVGSAVARGFASHTETRHLLLAAAVLLLGTSVMPLIGLRPADVGGAPVVRAPLGLRGQLVLLRGDPYLRRVAALVVVSSVVLTIVDYLFKSSVARVIGPAGLAVVFSTVGIALNALALVAQLVVLPWILKSVGVSRALALLPLLLLGGSLALAGGGGLIAALVLIAVTGTLKNTVHATASELLYVPLAGDPRSLVKGLLDGLGRRGGQALASLCILAAVGIAASDKLVAIGAAALALVWIGLSLGIHRHYLDLFRASLRRGTVHASADLPPLDLPSLEALVLALSSDEDAEVLASLDILAAQGRTKLIPSLILHHPSKTVVLRALELLGSSGRTDFLSVCRRLSSHADPDVRAATLAACSTKQPDRATLVSSLQDGAPAVRATALVGLAAAFGMSRHVRGVRLARCSSWYAGRSIVRWMMVPSASGSAQAEPWASSTPSLRGRAGTRPPPSPASWRYA